MTFRQMTTVGEMAFVSFTLDKMPFGKQTFGDLTFGEVLGNRLNYSSNLLPHNSSA